MIDGPDVGRMKIGGEYRLRGIGPRQWRKLAADLRLQADPVVASVRTMAERIPDLATSLLTRVREHGLAHDALERLARGLSLRARECAASLAESSG